MRTFILPTILAFATFLFSGTIFGVDAAFLYFDRNAVSANLGETFQVQVVVDAGVDQISSTDAYVLYDASLLEAQSIVAGTFFPTVTNNITSGKIYIAAFVDDPATYKTGSGAIATISFRTLKNGSGTLSFDCQPGVYNSSKIIKNDLNATNVIECSQNGTSTITIGQGGGPLPTTLPQTGVFENVAKVAIPGAVLLLIGGVLKLIL